MNIKVLVVDDFATMRSIVKDILKQIGFTNVIEADNGTTALAVIKKDKIDLIISDWNMPKMTGLDLLKTVRGDDSLKDIPFVMVTAEAQNYKVIQAIEAGVSNYIVKPFTAETLKEKLKQMFDT